MEKLAKPTRYGTVGATASKRQVVPSGEVSRPLFDTAFDFDNTNQSWRQIDKDVDFTYGEVGRKQPQNIRSVSSYKRIIRAEFLKYTAAPGK